MPLLKFANHFRPAFLNAAMVRTIYTAQISCGLRQLFDLSKIRRSRASLESVLLFPGILIFGKENIQKRSLYIYIRIVRSGQISVVSKLKEKHHTLRFKKKIIQTAVKAGLSKVNSISWIIYYLGQL